MMVSWAVLSLMMGSDPVRSMAAFGFDVGHRSTYLATGVGAFASVFERLAMPDSARPGSVTPDSDTLSALQLALRGIRNHCPRCDHKPLFRRYLKPVERCAGCGQDWTLHQADDFPAYIAIFISGHLLAPVLIAAGSRELLPMGVLAVIAILGALLLTIALLQPAKGAVIALQYHWRMHGFAGVDAPRPSQPD